MAEKHNYYNLLGLNSAATLPEIKSRFRELAKRFHPDRYFHPSQKIWATKRFQKLAEAYETLSSPEKRKEYNENLNIRNIKVEETYNERIQKNIYYFWWSRVYVYFLPVFFSSLPKLFPYSELSLWVVIAYTTVFMLLPWVLLSIFPPFWFALSSRHTGNMGCITTMILMIGMALGISFVMNFIRDPSKYRVFLQHLPISPKYIIIFYVIFIIVFLFAGSGLARSRILKGNTFFYLTSTLGLIISGIFAIVSFNRNNWIGFFIFIFYIAICIDFIISGISYEHLKSKITKNIFNTDIIKILEMESKD